MQEEFLNYKFNEGTRKLEPVDFTCRYCQKVTTDSVMHNVVLPITRVLDRTNLVILKSVSYKNMDLLVPRCEQCYKTHKKAKFLTWIIVILLGLTAGYLSFSPLRSKSFYAVYIIPIVMFFLWGFIRDYIVKLHKVKTELNGFKEEPLVSELTKDGWQIGKPHT